MKRLGAVILAIAMIGGAWLLRDRLDGDDGSGGSGGGGGDDVEQVRLRCATELEQVCRQLAEGRDDVRVSIEDPGTTSDALVALPEGDDPGFDAWLVDAPWAEITADNRRFANTSGTVLGDPSAVLARSPAVIAVQSQQLDGLTEACGGTISWRCIGEQPTSLRVGLATPERGDGLVSLAGATASFLGTTDYSTTDFEEPGFIAWFDRLTELSARTPLGRQSPLARAVVAPGTFQVTGALESQSAELLRSRDNYRAIYPEPMTTADIRLVPRLQLEASELVDRLGSDELGAALTDAGWRIDGRAPEGATDAPALPADAQLPAPGVLQQLRERW
ncbi:MAG: hypothetical protein ACK4V6_11395 [Microthrixaceae bacterium]